LQECPGGVDWATPLSPDYQVVGSARSHAGHVVLLVKKSIPAASISLNKELPMVVAQLKNSLWIASVHLAPFRDNAEERKQQVQALL